MRKHKSMYRIVSLILCIALILTSLHISNNTNKEISALDDQVNVGSDIASAWNNWYPISSYSNGSMLYPGQWSYNSANGYIVNAENTNDFTGFYNPTTNYEDLDISIDMGSWNGDDDTLGCMIRFSEDVNHNCYGYIFAYDAADSNGGATHGGLYKISGKQFFRR